jgi:hypothetical protein
MWILFCAVSVIAAISGKIGQGTQTIVESKPDERVRIGWILRSR